MILISLELHMMYVFLFLCCCVLHLFFLLLLWNLKFVVKGVHLNIRSGFGVEGTGG